MKPDAKPKPINNTRADKLAGFMWRYSFAEPRCLIPVTKFAEAEGRRAARPALGPRCRTNRYLPSRESGATPTSGDPPIR